ncbi:MAG: indolepyruvate oxidoreductase subunit beta [Thermoprotei archaeon]|mgnify:CR=1 FL=1|nr:MAG: indolepyruvate oxidoreductase subunit beta [Thermoprotei archaeon]
MTRINMVLSGVGGQGILTLAAVLGTAAILDGYDVRISEVHGMAQRGGSVICHVKIGDKINSPLVMEGSADIIISLEVSEVLKALHYLKPGGTIVVSSFELPPPLSMIRGLEYPHLDKVIDDAKRVASEIYCVDAYEVAKKIGSPLSANMVILGSTWATGKLILSKESLIKAIARNFKENIASVNIKAFEEGAKMVKRLL